ncbi:alternate signal-mediated exported protein%2C CPF_0494 family [uncultured Clostridium sp.]|nr:alternate signal-mediated exported protein%2C CPF_0494 family [uncultured Clostridium sp.]
MYQREHFHDKRKPNIRLNRTAVLIMAVLLLLGAAVGSTVAFLIDKTAPVENSFEYAKVSCEVTENFTNNKKDNVRVKNTGTTDAYIRATYVVNWVDAQGNIVASEPAGYKYTLTANLNNSWTKGSDGYFYYTSPIAPGDSTQGSLLTCTVTYPDNPEYTLSVEVLAEAIQSTPDNAVQEAWGVSISQGSVTAYSGN